MLPKGEYPATVAKVEVTRSRDKRWVAYVSVRADTADESLTARCLLAGAEAAEPLDMGPDHREGLLRFVRRMGLEVDEGEPPDRLMALLGASTGTRVVARVTQTPVGQRVTLLAHHHAEPEAIDGEIVHEQEAQLAHGAYERLTQAIAGARRVYVEIARAAYELRETSGWVPLGYGSMDEMLAQPEVSMERSAFLRAAQVWDLYAVRGGVEIRQLAAADSSKLITLAPRVRSGELSPAQATEQAQSLSLRDLRPPPANAPSAAAKAPSGRGWDSGDVLEATCRQVAGEIAYGDRGELRARLVEAADTYREGRE